MEHLGDTYLKLNDRANALAAYQKAMANRDRQKGKDREDPEKQKERRELQMKIRQLKEKTP
jgi:predicted negative regulator of RcsB-dependent stress response